MRFASWHRARHAAADATAGIGALDRREPVIGLALGGGAARGWAHIGVMRALDAAGYRPSVVVGTSIGAVVGGCWAAEKLDQLEGFARGLTKRGVFSLMDFRLPGSGFIAGTRLRRQLEENLGSLQIEDLPVRYAAVSTEIGNGHEVWLTRGLLSDAMRASYALPGVFVPVKLAGRWLVDGALVNPVPVSTARALGADLVIAVNLHSDVFGRSGVVHDHGSDHLPADAGAAGDNEEPKRTTRLLAPVYGAARMVRRPFAGAGADRPQPVPRDTPGIGAVMMHAFNITQDRIARSRLAGDPPDVNIGPKLGRIGLSEFHRAEEAITLGRLAGERAINEIEEARAALMESV
jgi:NTE family protein